MLKQFLIRLVKIYQLIVSPYLGKNCRYYPSCSEYMIEAINKYGVMRGLIRGFVRLIKCGPFCAGGHDPV